jgi:hypothetical protein
LVYLQSSFLWEHLLDNVFQVHISFCEDRKTLKKLLGVNTKQLFSSLNYFSFVLHTF